jgi:hypothetical protein
MKNKKMLIQLYNDIGYKDEKDKKLKVNKNLIFGEYMHRAIS